MSDRQKPDVDVGCDKHCAYMIGCETCDAKTVKELAGPYQPANAGTMIHDNKISCPVCRKKGKMLFRPNANRHVRYSIKDGRQVAEHFGRSADCKCSVCGCEFTLTNIGKGAR